jgi:hypothetical protein
LPDCQNRIAASFLKSFKSDLDIYISGNNCKSERSVPVFRVMEESFLSQTFEKIVYIQTSGNTYFDHHIFNKDRHISSYIDKHDQSESNQSFIIILSDLFSGSDELILEKYLQLSYLLKNEMFKFYKSL